MEVFIKTELSEAIKQNAQRPINKQVDKQVIETSIEQLDIVPNKYLIVWDKNDTKLETFEGKIMVPHLEKQAQVSLDSFNSLLFDSMDRGTRKTINE